MDHVRKKLGVRDEDGSEVERADVFARGEVELVGAEAAENAGLVDAAELARRLGVKRSWVYAHASELGAVMLGHGPRPRLRFEPRTALGRLPARESSEGPRKPIGPRQRRPSPVATSRSGFLPIKR